MHRFSVSLDFCEHEAGWQKKTELKNGEGKQTCDSKSKGTGERGMHRFSVSLDFCEHESGWQKKTEV